MEDIDHWFLNELQPDDSEVITGLCECDYPPRRRTMRLLPHIGTA